MLTEITGDLYNSAKKEIWAYIGLCGFFTFHLGIILCVLAFEGAIEQEAEIYIQVLSILLILSGPMFMIFSVYIRNKQRKRLRTFVQNHNRKANYHPRKKTIKNQKDTIQFSPKMLREINKAKVSPTPWFSDNSGPISESSRRNIEAWIIEHHNGKNGKGKKTTPDDSFTDSSLGSTPPNRLSSLV